MLNVCVSLAAPHLSQEVDPGALFPLPGIDWLFFVPVYEDFQVPAAFLIKPGNPNLF